MVIASTVSPDIFSTAKSTLVDVLNGSKSDGSFAASRFSIHQISLPTSFAVSELSVILVGNVTAKSLIMKKRGLLMQPAAN